MKKYKLVVISIFLLILLIVIYPHIEFKKNSKLYIFSYSDDYSEWEDNMCYQESYSYNKKRNISINGWAYHKFLFFKWCVLDYVDGNVCDSEYMLEETYIENFVKNATIIENENNINLKKLISGKTAIVGNKRYYTEEEKMQIFYILDGKEEEMFVFYSEDLLIIQVGLSDEGPKFIAYK